MGMGDRKEQAGSTTPPALHESPNSAAMLCSVQDMWVDAQQAALQSAVQALPRLPEAIVLLADKLNRKPNDGIGTALVPGVQA